MLTLAKDLHGVSSTAVYLVIAGAVCVATVDTPISGVLAVVFAAPALVTILQPVVGIVGAVIRTNLQAHECVREKTGRYY